MRKLKINKLNEKDDNRNNSMYLINFIFKKYFKKRETERESIYINRANTQFYTYMY